MQQLYDIAESLDVVIEYADLERLDRDGDYNQRTRTIRLQHGMLYRLERSVLAHELAHAVFQDEPSMFGPANARMERRADEWAAHQLISYDDYRAAEARHGHKVDAIAQDLSVIDDLVDAYQHTLHRIGNTIYVSPRMGAKQYTDRISA